MKVCLTLSSSLLLSASLLILMKMRNIELEKEERQRTFLDIKLRVTLDVWSEYQRQIEETTKTIQLTDADEKVQSGNLNVAQGQLGNLKTLLLECTGHEKTSADELATANTELQFKTDENKKEVDSWENERAVLKQQLAEQSKVCDYLLPNSEAVRQFCGDKVSGPAKVVVPQAAAAAAPQAAAAAAPQAAAAAAPQAAAAAAPQAAAAAAAPQAAAAAAPQAAAAAAAPQAAAPQAAAAAPQAAAAAPQAAAAAPQAAAAAPQAAAP